MKAKNKWRLEALLLILTLVLISCRTLTETTKSNLGDFPLPYDQEGNLVAILTDRVQETDQEITLRKITEANTQEPEDPAVLLPLWYWKKIVRFAIDAKGVKHD